MEKERTEEMKKRKELSPNQLSKRMTADFPTERDLVIKAAIKNFSQFLSFFLFVFSLVGWIVMMWFSF